MERYFFRLDGEGHKPVQFECASLDEARNEAVRYLGSYLADHPGFADEGHWRVNVENEFGQSYLHVIVATVTSRDIKKRGAVTGE